MIFKPHLLAGAAIPEAELIADKKGCQRFGPCGVSDRALYLNSFFLDRRYYLPIGEVRRVFKRIAMSKGGFTGKGMFASIPYLVVEYGDGQVKQCNFKFEEDVDRLLDCMAEKWPDIPRRSVEAQRKLDERERMREARFLKDLTPEAQAAWDRLEEAKAQLAHDPAACDRLSQAAREKRRNDQTNPAYKWVALAIVIFGALALAFGIWTLIRRDTSGIYFMLIGLAAVFFFSGAQVLPTARNNRKAIDREWADANEAVAALAGKGFPVPAHYAHPIVLDRMIRALREGRARNVDQALKVVKEDLRKLNSTVRVDQEEYEEVIRIKPIFLLHNYK